MRIKCGRVWVRTGDPEGSRDEKNMDMRNRIGEEREKMAANRDHLLGAKWGMEDGRKKDKKNPLEN